MQTKHINLILSSAHSVFYLTALINAKSAPSTIPEDFRQQVTQAFVQFEKQSLQHGIQAQKIADAKYALAAFVDELVLYSSWAGRSKWMSLPLQLEFFGEHLAGEGFFNRLSNIRQNALADADVLELYYVCLQLGFAGRYRNKNAEALLGLQADLRSQLEAINGATANRLSPEVIPQQGLVAKVSREVPLWVIASVAMALIFVMYIAYSFAIGEQLNRSVANIDAQHGALMQRSVKL